MSTFTVTVGWTDDPSCCSYFEGYRPGARQHVETLQVQWDNPPKIAAPDDILALAGGDAGLATLLRADAERRAGLRTVETLAEAVYEATNDPFASNRHGLTGQVYRAVRATGYDGRGAHYSLSVGDTVTVTGEGFPAIAVELTRDGWAKLVRVPE